MMIADLIEELTRLKDIEDLLRTVLMENREFGYRGVPGLSAETQRRVRKFMNFDDSE